MPLPKIEVVKGDRPVNAEGVIAVVNPTDPIRAPCPVFRGDDVAGHRALCEVHHAARLGCGARHDHRDRDRTAGALRAHPQRPRLRRGEIARMLDVHVGQAAPEPDRATSRSFSGKRLRPALTLLWRDGSVGSGHAGPSLGRRDRRADPHRHTGPRRHPRRVAHAPPGRDGQRARRQRDGGAVGRLHLRDLVQGGGRARGPLSHRATSPRSSASSAAARSCRCITGNDFDMDEETYFRIIEDKTAALYAAALRCGAVL